MPVPVYRRLYDSAAAAGGGTIVEIGTYCGVATRTPWLAAAYRRIRSARRR
jgi:predicted O-methyltransferase YrrM